MFGMLQANFAFQRHFTHERDLIGFFSSWSSELSCNRQAFLLTFCCGRVTHRSLEDRKEPSLPRTTCEKLYAESVSFLNDLLKQQKNPLLNLNVSFVMNFWQCSSKLFISVFNMFTLFEFQTICPLWFCFVYLFPFFSPDDRGVPTIAR